MLINLLKNSSQSLEKSCDGIVEITAFRNIENRIIIKVNDNGVGISSDTMDDIFIPFYTTKDNGYGIGLSLSRQIMRLHRGTIYVDPVPDKDTIVTLVF